MSILKVISVLGAGVMVCFSQEKLSMPPVNEVGVYFQHKGQWMQLTPELITWKSGGDLKKAANADVVKRDANAYLEDAGSEVNLSLSKELLVYCPEGAEITEYRLIHFRTRSKSREFRTIPGGMSHTSGGVRRDNVRFVFEQVASRTYTIDLSALPAGEYGLIPPGADMAGSASAQLGEAYTFALVALKANGESGASTQSSARNSAFKSNAWDEFSDDRPLWAKILF